MTDGWGISNKVAIRWISPDLTKNKSTLVQVMAWCRQATSHYLRQCWPRFMLPNGITRLQWVNIHKDWCAVLTQIHILQFNSIPSQLFFSGLIYIPDVCNLDPNTVKKTILYPRAVISYGEILTSPIQRSLSWLPQMNHMEHVESTEWTGAVCMCTGWGSGTI